jgi:AraC-like DNA-binding protein
VRDGRSVPFAVYPNGRVAELHRVVSLVPEPERMARLRAAFGDVCRPAQSQSELIRESRLPGVELVVVSPFDRERRSLATAVAAIRASRASPPVHVYSDRSIESVREIIALAQAGARALILAGVDDDATRLRGLLDVGTLPRAVETVRIVALENMHPRYAPLVTRCLENVTEPLTALAFARSLGVRRRTLTSWAESAGVRGVRSLTSRCRVLVAIEMLKSPQQSIEHVALALGFSSSAHLHNTVKRYTGCRPRETATRDAMQWLGVLFHSACARPRPPGESRPPPAEWSREPNGETVHPDQAEPEE